MWRYNQDKTKKLTQDKEIECEVLTDADLIAYEKQLALF